MNKEIKPNYLKILFLSGSSFGLLIGLLLTPFVGPSVAFGRGILAGLIFGAIITIFVAVMSKRTDAIQRKFIGDTQVILKGGANHILPGEAVGGWLYLTQETLSFISTGYNFQDHKGSIPLNNIVLVEKFNMFGIVPNGMRVITRNGQESFVVNNRKRWIREISSCVSKQQEQ